MGLTKKVTDLTALLLAAVAAVGGAVLVYLGSLHVGTLGGALGTAVGSALLSIGLLGVFYEIWLRRNVRDELLELVGIQSEVARASLESLGQVQDVQWKPLLSQCGELTAAMHHPAAWIESNWPYMLNACRQKPVSIRISLPDPDAPFFESLARQLGYNAVDYESEIRRAGQSLEQKWKDAVAGHQLHAGCSISIELVKEMPRYSVYIVDHRAIVVFGSAFARRGTDADLYLMFFGNTGAYPNSWMRTQLSDGRAAGAPVYANEVIR